MSIFTKLSCAAN